MTAWIGEMERRRARNVVRRGGLRNLCTCGNPLVKNVNPSPNTNEERSPHPAGKKSCKKCGLLWTNSKRICVCGYLMIPLKTSALRSKRKRQKCGSCGLDLKGHECLAKPARKTPTRRVAKKLWGCDSAPTNLPQPTTQPASKPVSIVTDNGQPASNVEVSSCGVCKLRSTISNLSKISNTQTLKLNLISIERGRSSKIY